MKSKNIPSCTALNESKYGDSEEYEFISEEFADYKVVQELYFRLEDETYWRASFKCDSTGKYDSLDESRFSIVQVAPKEFTIIKYLEID